MEKRTAGRRRVEPGPTAGRVAANLRHLRGRVTLSELSQRMAKAGRPILPSGLSKIEQGDRSVDVDDLMALAVALGVSPNRLLLTEQARDDHEIALTEHVRQSEANAWRWASGERSLQENGEFLWQELDFPRANRPHVPPEPTSGEMDHLRKTGNLNALTEGYRRARGAGVTPSQIQAHVQTLATMEDLASLAQLTSLAQKIAEHGPRNTEPSPLYLPPAEDGGDGER
jgi:transcriptional regulator with XRE-family HTH domain